MACVNPEESEILGDEDDDGFADVIWAFFLPNEKVLPPALKPRGLDPGTAGRGIL